MGILGVLIVGLVNCWVVNLKAARQNIVRIKIYSLDFGTGHSEGVKAKYKQGSVSERGELS